MATGTKGKDKSPVAIPPELADMRLVRPAQLAATFGTTPSHLYRMVERGELPAPVRISHRVSGWPLAEVRDRLTRRDEPSGTGEQEAAREVAR